MKKPLSRGARATIPAMSLPARSGRAPAGVPRSVPSVRALVAVSIAGLLAASCGTPGPAPSQPPSAPPSAVASAPANPSPSAAPSPNPSASVDEASLYRQIEDDVITLRGLPAKQRLEPTILDEAQLRVRIEAQFRAENSPAEIATSQATLVAMGLLPPGTSLGDLYVNLLGSQVAGYYDPATKQIYVVARAGRIGAIEKVTFAHEFTHALQDQNFGLEGIQTDAIGQGDRSLAHLALIEGDASLLMTQWLTGHLDAAALGEILAADPAAQAQLDATPPVLRDALLFPYTQGLLFVNTLFAKGGWAAVDDAFDRPPDSTEQVLHADKYAAGERPVSVPLDAATIAARLGPGWKTTAPDTLGEFQVGSWLRARGVTGAGGGISGDAAAAGWGGDRYDLVEGPNGAYVLVLLTAWDTPADATEFATAATEAVRGVPGEARVVPFAPRPGVAGNGVVAVLFASGTAILQAVAGMLKA